jgi:hypothetical protein
MPFRSYYLWYLIDRFGFVIDDVNKQKNDGCGTFCKNILNATYGKDGMNKSKYSKLVIMNQKKDFFSQCLPEFKGSRAIRNNRYIVEKNYRTYSVNTTIQEAVHTLDNAKFWNIKFVYDFICMCIDMLKIHFIEDDADTLYYAISGNSDEDCNQGFKHVVKDVVFYKENVYEWFPNPNLPKEEQTRDKKKLLGVSFEKEG